MCNVFEPVFFFPEILQNEQGSFAQVDTEILNQFVDNAVFRANQDMFIFDHLSVSVSKRHANFKPINEVSIQMFAKITSDLLN